METNIDHRSSRTRLFGLIGWLAVVFVAAAIGAIASVDAKSFYAELTRPSWAPPGYVFGPVWTTLYTLMGISAWLVWRNSRLYSWAIIIFVIQLSINALWSWLFFAWHLGAWAFWDVLLLWVFIIATMILFWPVNRMAALLLVPYFLWVSFASVLTWYVWQMNPGLL